MKKILGMGNSLVDILFKLENDSILSKFNLPKGSMQLVDKEKSSNILSELQNLNKQQTSGGSAANTIHGLAGLGQNTSFIGKVGKDELGNFFENNLIENNIKPVLLKSNTESGRAITFISPDSERTFATYLGASVELSAEDLKKEFFQNFEDDIFHIEGYLLQNHNLIETAIKLAKENKMIISLDLASYNVVEENLDFLKKIIKEYVDVIFANEEEAKAFTGLEPEDALNKIAEICEYAIVKIGKEGSFIKYNDEIHKIKPILAEAVDTTGAGDLYASGFLYGLANNLSISQSGKIASLMSANVVETIGGKIPKNKWKKILETVNNIKNG